MTEFNYNDIIEYIDCTFDENFENAKQWCIDNDAQLIEIIERRKEINEKLYRYFQIQENPRHEPTQQELIQQEIERLKNFLFQTDYVVIKIAEGEEETPQALEIISERKQARIRINELEEQLENQ
jgi:hypothetical protein